MKVDIEKLRDDLIDYYGTAFCSGFGAAVIEIGEIENASPGRLVQIAEQSGIDLSNYEIDD